MLISKAAIVNAGPERDLSMTNHIEINKQKGFFDEENRRTELLKHSIKIP